MGEGFSPEFEREPEEPEELERTPEGDINNCALANFVEESECQMCLGTCPDRDRLTTLGRFFASKLDEHIRPEIQALAKRGNVTPVEIAELRINSWEWEHLVPAMNDEAFVARMEHSIKNCGWHKRPFGNYNEAVEGLYAPELLKRFKLASQTLDAVRMALGRKWEHNLLLANDVAVLVKALEWYAASTTMSMGESLATRAQVSLAVVRQRAVSTTCEVCGRKLYLVEPRRPEDDAPITLCAGCGGGCTAWPTEEVLP
jgi:hypothetical protein